MTTLDATPATEALRLPGAPGDLAPLVHQAGGRRRRRRRPGHRGDVHASRLRGRRRTPATCSSCCRCAAAWTACRPSCPTRRSRLRDVASRTSRSPRDSCCPWAASSGCTRRWVPQALLRRRRLRRRAGGRHGRAEPFALLGDGGDGARGARLLAADRLARPRPRPASRRRTLPGHPAGLEHRRERVPGTGPGARDVVDRLVRPGRRVDDDTELARWDTALRARARGGARR